MTTDNVRTQLERVIDQAVASGGDIREALQHAVDFGAECNMRLQEIEDSLDQLTEIQLSWQSSDEELCDE